MLSTKILNRPLRTGVPRRGGRAAGRAGSAGNAGSHVIGHVTGRNLRRRNQENDHDHNREISDQGHVTEGQGRVTGDGGHHVTGVTETEIQNEKLFFSTCYFKFCRILTLNFPIWNYLQKPAWLWVISFWKWKSNWFFSTFSFSFNFQYFYSYTI